MRRRSRLLVGLTLAGSLLVPLGVTAPSQADDPMDWTCVFGRAAAGSPYTGSFTFTSLPGLFNDTAFLSGTGTCTGSLENRVLNARIDARSWERHDHVLGRCDKDPADTGGLSAGFGQFLRVGMDAVVTIDGHAPAPLILRFFLDPAPWPGPMPNVGRVSEDVSGRRFGLNRQILLSTRIAGRCPPQGNDTAAVLRMEFRH